jgi:thioredoxin-like negative regulator of GroEL
MAKNIVFRIGDLELREILERGQGWTVAVFRSFLSIPCEHYAPEFRIFAEKTKAAYCVELSEEDNPTLVNDLRVKTVPTTLFIYRTKVVDQLEGAYSNEYLVQHMAKLMEGEKT